MNLHLPIRPLSASFAFLVLRQHRQLPMAPPLRTLASSVTSISALTSDAVARLSKTLQQWVAEQPRKVTYTLLGVGISAALALALHHATNAPESETEGLRHVFTREFTALVLLMFVVVNEPLVVEASVCPYFFFRF